MISQRLWALSSETCFGNQLKCLFLTPSSERSKERDPSGPRRESEREKESVRRRKDESPGCGEGEDSDRLIRLNVPPVTRVLRAVFLRGHRCFIPLGAGPRDSEH